MKVMREETGNGNIFGWHRSPIRSDFVREGVSEGVSQPLFTMFPWEDLDEIYTLGVSW